MDVAKSTQEPRTTVLLIDDNDDDRKYWSGVLRSPSFHYSVLEASSGEEGLNLCRDKKVDCVVLDFDMPLSGYFTLLELVSDPKHPQIPVIILSCLVHPVLWELTKHNGAQDWLVKQHTSAEDLHRAIQTAIAAVSSLSKKFDT